MPPGRPPRTPDVAGLVRALQAHGMSCSSIARALHVQPSTITRWRDGGRMPHFDNGAGLVGLLHGAAESSAAHALLPLLWHRTTVVITANRAAPDVWIATLRARKRLQAKILG